jgi:hypothetical protein
MSLVFFYQCNSEINLVLNNSCRGHLQKGKQNLNYDFKKLKERALCQGFSQYAECQYGESPKAECHFSECRYAEYHYCECQNFFNMLSVNMLSVNMLSVNMMSVNMIMVIMPSVNMPSVIMSSFC